MDEGAQCAFVCDGVVLPCGRSRNVEVPDSLSRGAFSPPLRSATGLVGCRLLVQGKTDKV